MGGCERAVGMRAIGWADSVGRMAFSNYIVPVDRLGLIFYGYGLGLFGIESAVPRDRRRDLRRAGQFSRWGFDRFSFGPLEVWRSLMYGKRQPLLPTLAAASGSQIRQPFQMLVSSSQRRSRALEQTRNRSRSIVGRQVDPRQHAPVVMAQHDVARFSFG